MLGLLYAGAWLVLADRAAGAGKRTSATFHGLTAAAIGSPLLWEATVKFEYLSPTTSMPATVALAGAGLVVASRRGVHVLIWIVVAPRCGNLGRSAPHGAKNPLGTSKEFGAPYFSVLMYSATDWISSADSFSL
jgi:hypothetical protein